MASLPDLQEPIESAFWRCCAGCSAWLACPHDLPQDASIYCQRCEARNAASWADFDPRPHPARGRPAVPAAARAPGLAARGRAATWISASFVGERLEHGPRRRSGGAS